ncbi:MAG TPA: class II aldolase/adducin family protein [Chloroflexota bacterium]
MSADLAALKRRLCDGLQVLTGEGVLTGSGHLSCRVPDSDTFLINPRFAGVLADPGDVCTVSAAGQRIAGAGPIPSETAIHAAVYARRPDVASVLHCHPRYSILVGLLDEGLIPFDREARLFADGVPIFPDSRGIRTAEHAAAMVDCLGDHWGLFLRGHGVVVGGPSTEGTCVSAIQLERACQDQLLLMSFTKPQRLADADRGRSNARLENPYRAWPYLLFKNGVRSRDEIKAAVRPPAEGEHY